MPSLPLASPALQRRLHLGDTGDANAADLRDNLSGLAGRDSWLWLAGDEGEPLALDPQRSASGQVLGCLHLDGRGFPRSGQRLRCHTTNSEDALTAALAANALIRPFLAIPSKDNGLDIEGITARDNRVLLGLRGPVLRGIALVAELRLVVLGWGGRAQGLDGIAAAVTLVVNGSHGQRRQTLFTAPGVEKNRSESETQGASNGSYSQGSSGWAA